MWDSVLVNSARRVRDRGLTPGRPARRAGGVALALLIGSAGAALLVAYLFHLGVAQNLVAVLVGGGALASLYLAWSSYRDDARRAETASLERVAGELAGVVRLQWETEARIRRLNDPYPLPVRWTATDTSLAAGWDVLETLAHSGAGWPSPAPAGTWATGPDGLAGEGGGLADVLTRVPTGRLVVLGEPGAGKTMLMVRLVLDLLARRATGGPVPVQASLASWNPERQDLHGWLAAQLTTDHPVAVLMRCWPVA
jgi:hypothetical protein